MERTLITDLLSSETVATINWTVITGLEGHLAVASAIGTGGIEHFSFNARIAFSCIAAGLTALRLIGKALFCKKLLLVCGKSKFYATVFAHDCLVLIH